MASNAMNDILTRLFLDGRFRERLRTDPEAALVGYELTRQEWTMLSRLKRRLSTRKPREETVANVVEPQRPFRLK